MNTKEALQKVARSGSTNPAYTRGQTFPVGDSNTHCESSYFPDALRLLFLSFPNPRALALLFYHYSEVSPKPTAPFTFSYLYLSPLSFLYLHRFPFRLSPISADPYLFPDSHEHSLAIAPLLRFLLISSPIAAVSTLAAQLAYRGNPSLRLSHPRSTFPTDRENSLTLAPLFVTFHCGHALLFSGHGHASKQYIRRAPCTVVSSDSIWSNLSATVCH